MQTPLTPQPLTWTPKWFWSYNTLRSRWPVYCTLNTCFSPIQDMLSAWSISITCWMLWGEIEENKKLTLASNQTQSAWVESQSQRMNEAFSTTSINMVDCDGWWLPGGCSSMVEHWSQEPWDQFLSTGWCFAFLTRIQCTCLYFRSLFKPVRV